jgi:hypothetical protein
LTSRPGLATDMNIMMRETLHNIDLKDVKRHILAAASTTDIVHRATMNNSAMTSLYNHVLMALPSTDEDFQPLDKEILSFLSTKIVKAETFQKRRLVARK